MAQIWWSGNVGKMVNLAMSKATRGGNKEKGGYSLPLDGE